jgi:hypothetical protein
MPSARTPESLGQNSARTGQTLLWWWRGADDEQTLSKLTQLLEGDPIPNRIVYSLPVPQKVSITAREDCTERVCWLAKPTLKPHVLFVPAEKRYNVELSYADSHRENDPYLAPHTFFHALKPGGSFHALEFLNKFGPPDRRDESRNRKRLPTDEIRVFHQDSNTWKTRPTWVDLGDFWDKHRRFSVVLHLWNARHDRPALVRALQSVDEMRIWPMIGARPGGIPAAYPWDRPGYGDFGQWALSVSDAEVADAASELIANELELNASGLRIRWRRYDADVFRFRVDSGAPNLWTAMWCLFARDTEFCEQHKDFQKQWSRNKWWQEHKTEELEKRKRARKAKLKSNRRKKLSPTS